ncbi:MAG: hypothetical protein ACLSCO_17930 [Gallintestinimicrobium sp.]
MTQPCGAEQGTTQDGCIRRSAVFQNYMRYQMTLQDNVIDQRHLKKNAPLKPPLGANGLKAGSSCAVQRTDAVAGV